MKKSPIFWIGYSDLMTSLFFIMLVLFVLTVGYLQIKNTENLVLITQSQAREAGLIQEKERLEKLLNLEKQFAPLIEDNSFYYLPECNKFISKDLMSIEIFEPDKTQIKNEFIQTTINVGQKIETFLRKLHQENKEFSYLLVIEGNMANDYLKSKSEDRADFYIRSYERALAVYNLWLTNGINFRTYNAELMICGSGLSGLCRDSVEENNKRFSIQIIPKVSN